MTRPETAPMRRHPLPTSARFASAQHHSCFAGVRDLHSWPQYQAALAPLVATLDSTKPSPTFGATNAGTAMGITLPPTYTLLPLSVSFLVLMVLACLTSTEATTSRSSHLGGAMFSNSPSLLSYATNCLPHGKPQGSGQSPHLRLLAEYLRALLPQGKTESLSTAAMTFGGTFLAVLLETLLTDPDMPVPTSPVPVSGHQAVAGGVFKAQGQRGQAHYVPPMLLQSKCIKVPRLQTIAYCSLLLGFLSVPGEVPSTLRAGLCLILC
jgi:hypothetical protein